MKKTFVRLLSVAMCVVMTLTAAPLGGFVGLDLPSLFDFKAEAASSGTCGENLTWTYDSGVLTISGTGAMTDWYFSNTQSKKKAPWYSYNITSVVIDEGVTNIGEYAFYDCDSLTDVLLPQSVTHIDNYAFDSCSELTSLPVGNYPISIGDYAFSNCSGLTDVIIPDNVISIGESVFNGCYNLKNISIGSGLAEIGDGAFSFIDMLNKITVDADNQYFTVDSYGALYSKDMTRLVQYPINDTRASYTIPEGVTAIDSGAFLFCYDITKITLPDSLKTIGENAFAECYNLSSITLPAGLETISDDAISWYTTPYYSGTLEQWETVEKHPNDTSLSLQIIICGGTDRPYHIPGTCGTNLNWILYADGELVISGNGAMKNWSSMPDAPWYSLSERVKSITVENGVSSIGSSAFYYCENATKVTIAETVTSIGIHAFNGCYGIKELTMPVSAKLPVNYAFGGCQSIEKLTLTAGTGVMQDFSSESSNYSKTQYWYTPWYESRTSLKEIIIEDGITNIGDYAFYYNTGLECITIPSGITTIGDNAFRFCEELTDVYYSSTQENWNKISIGIGNEQLASATLHTVTASGTCGDNLDWVLYDTGRLEITGTGAMTSWTAPNKTPWYDYRTEINEIIIGERVTSIGEFAFTSCTAQKSVSIPESVTSIEASAFGNTRNITNVHFASDKSDWDKITVGDTNNALTHAVYSFGRVRLVDSGWIGEFEEWELYTDGELYLVGEDGMSNLSSAEHYPWHEYRDKITSFTIESYPDDMYMEMSNIGNHALEGCVNLKTVNFNSTVTRIGNSAFEGCTSLESIVIPDSVTEIGDRAFYGCTGLKAVNYNGTFEQWCKVTVKNGNPDFLDLLVFDSDTDRPYYAPGVCGESLEWVLYTDGELVVTGTGAMTDWSDKSSVPWSAYSDEIKTVTISDSVTNIGDNAFCECASLSGITIPNSVTSIGRYAFNKCISLADVYYNSPEEDWNKISINDYNEPLNSTTIHFAEYKCKHPEDELNWHTVVEPTCAPGKENLVCSVCGYNGCYEVICDPATYPKCSGNYEEWVDRTYNFSYPGAEKLILKFSEKTSIYEYLYIYDSKGNMLGCYSGSQLSGKTVEVDGDSVKLRIIAETLYSGYGFSFDSIIAVMSVDGWVREKPASEDYPHDWSYENGICTECGYQCPHKNVSNGICNECSFCNHYDPDGDDVCYFCGGLVGAKILTVDSEGRLYVDGDLCYSNIDDEAYLGSGKYKLIGNITTVNYFYVSVNKDVKIDLNGYTWDLGQTFIDVEGTLSVRDSSAEKTGKITSSATTTISVSYGGSNSHPVLNLFSGIIENTSSVDYSSTISFSTANIYSGLTANLYGGKLKGNYFNIYYPLDIAVLINIDSTVLESGEGCAQIKAALGYGNAPKSVVDVTDYTGDSLTVTVNTYKVQKIKIFQGIKSAADSDKYIAKVTSANGTYCLEKEEYDSATGEKYIYVAENAFVKQPTAANNFTADFNNTDATIQWYETERIELTDKNTTAFEYAGLPQATTSVGKWVVNGECVLFSYDVKAGCTLYVFSESYKINAFVYVGDHTLSLNTGKQPSPITFDTDTTIYVKASAATMAVLGFTLVKNTLLEDETNEVLHKPECGKSYFCRANVLQPHSDPVIFDSNTVTVSHNWNNGACKICKNNCIEPLNSAIIDTESNMIYGLAAGVNSLNDYIKPADGLKFTCKHGQYGFGTGTVATLKDGSKIIAEYTVIIFGDIDGNGWYDANDAFIVNMIASGLISADRLSEAQQRAADCNHDGAVDGADFYLLNQASLMLEDVDQSAIKDQLATNAMYIGYCSLIDQTAGEETNLVPVPDNNEAPSDNTADIEPSESAEASELEAIFIRIIDFFKKIIAFIFGTVGVSVSL